MSAPNRLFLALLLVGSVLLAACGGAADETTPEVVDDVTETPDEDRSSPPTDSAGVPNSSPNDDNTPVDNGTDPGDDQEPGSDDRPHDTSADDAGFTVEPEGQELALVGNDTVEILYTLDPEGESFFASAAVRPGSTRDDMIVVAITHAEGMYDLRWLEVVGGQVGELHIFPEAYRMVSDVSAYDGSIPAVVWSPDGDTIAWFEPGDDGTVLRTVGWSQGPGTGDDADDNASWVVDGTSTVLRARSWEVAHSDGSHTLLNAEDAGGTTYRLQLERQADGAWAYHGLEG